MALQQHSRGKSSMMSSDGNPPEMSKAEAIAKLAPYNNAAQGLMMLATQAPYPLPVGEIEVLVYSPMAKVSYIFKNDKLALGGRTTLRGFVFGLQGLVDQAFRKKEMAGEAGEKYVLHQIEIIIFTRSTGPLPRISGNPVYQGADRDLKTASVEGVIWNLDAEMTSYWNEVKTRIQLGGVDDSPREIKKPLIKVYTTRKGEADVIPGVDLFKEHNGHFFISSSTCSLRSSMPPVQAAMGLDANAKAKFREHPINPERPMFDLGQTGSFSHNTGFVNNNSFAHTKAPKRVPKMPPNNANKEANDIMGKLNEVGNPLNLQEGEIELGLKVSNVVKDNMKAGEQGGNGEGSSKSTSKSNVEGSYQEHLSRGRKPAKGPSVNKRTQGTKRKARPDENWGKYQHMGGDPCIRKACDLSGAPFEPATSKKLVSPEDPNNLDAGKDGDTVKSVAEEADTSIKMVSQMTSEEMATAMGMSDYHGLHRDMNARGMISRMDAGLGFTEEDDYLFVPAMEAIEENPSLRLDPTRVDALLGLVPQNKKLETLRALGNSLLSPAAPPSSLNNSPYLGALGGVAPPAGMYNTSSSMASTPGSGLPIQNPYQATMGQSASSSPLTSWPQMAATPPLGFYDTTTPSAESGMGMNTGGGRRSSLDNSARTHSRSGTQSNVGGGASLRVESPASHSAATPSASRSMFSPPVTGRGLQGQQQAVLPGRQYDAPGAPWENGRGYPGQQQVGLPGRQYDAPGAPWENGRGYPGQQQAVLPGRQYDAPGAPWENGRGYPGQQQAVLPGRQYDAPGAPWENGRGYPGQQQVGVQGQQYGGALEMGRTGSRASDLHGQQGGGSPSGRSGPGANSYD